MSAKLPIGRKEDLHLEFKNRDALKNPESIAREIVALLNAEGGDLWVGVREDHGVAVEVEGLEDPELVRQRLRDAVVDLVDPPPADNEVTIEVVGGKVSALRIQTSPRLERRPYALRRGGKTEFPIRFSDRLRPMTRTEVEEAFTSARECRGNLAATDFTHEENALLADERAALTADSSVLWLGAERLDGAGPLDLKRFLDTGILEDPTRSGNRWGGINFGLALHAVLLGGERSRPYPSQKHGRTWLTLGGASPFVLSIAESGSFRSEVLLAEAPFACPPEPLQSPFPELSGERVLNPKALLEYPASLFRLARAIQGDRSLWQTPPESDVPWIASVALANVEGWYIRPGPDHPAWNFPFSLKFPPPALQRRPRPFTDGRSFVGRVLRFSEDEVLTSPDTCAFRLMAQVFAAFGWFEDEIPFFDRATGKLDFLS